MCGVGLLQLGPGERAFLFLFFIEVELIYNVSGVQQSESVVHIHLSLLFKILFLDRLLQNIE